MENKRRFVSLVKKRDFDGLRNEGKRFHVNTWFLANVLSTQTGQIRCGWSIPRHVGSAVIRNRLRRWGREYLRKWSDGHTRDWDINLVFKRREKDFFRNLDHRKFDEEMGKFVARLDQPKS